MRQERAVYRDGTFFLDATLDALEPTPIGAGDYLGVDLGIVDVAVDAEGVVCSAEAVERIRRTVARRHRNLRRKGAKGATPKLRTVKRVQARYQTDTDHVISARVVAVAKGTGRGIAVEDRGGTRDRTTVRRRQRARHATRAFAQRRAFLEYKVRMAGLPCVAADPRGTGRTCPACGQVDQADRVSQARSVCGRCAFVGGADHVAARTISCRARAAVMPPMAGRSVETRQAAPTSRLLPLAVHDPKDPYQLRRRPSRRPAIRPPGLGQLRQRLGQ